MPNSNEKIVQNLPCTKYAMNQLATQLMPREAARHAFVDAGKGAIEVLDVHQEDAEQRKPSHHIQGFDPLIRGNRRQILVGHCRRCGLHADRFHSVGHHPRFIGLSPRAFAMGSLGVNIRSFAKLVH